MEYAYEALIRMIEGKEVNGRTDGMIQALGEEMQRHDFGRPAFIEAVDYLSDDPATDTKATTRLRRVLDHCRLFPEELDRQIGILVDVVFGSHQFNLAEVN